MKKMNINDIAIKTPGVQIREKIIEKFGSIKVFAEEIDLYEASINQYLSSKTLGSSTFKIRTTSVFGKDFNELYMSEEEQVRYMTSTISWYIEDYNKFEDINIFEKLKKICIEKELYEDYAIVCRCYAKYFMNQGEKDRAYAYMELAVNSMRGKENIDRFGLYLSDLICMKVGDINKTQMTKFMHEFDEVIKKVKGPLTKGNMYSNLGDAFMYLEEYEKSKFYYKEIFKYNNDSRSKALIYTKIGQVEKYLGYNKEALLNYNKAKELLSTEDNFIKYVYDQYASYYLKGKHLEKAEEYIDKIFSDKHWKISSSNHRFLRTFSEIKIALNKQDQIVNVIRRVLDEIDDGYIYTASHLSLIDEIVMCKFQDSKLLNKLQETIVSYCLNNQIEGVYKNMLKSILGGITINLYKAHSNK